MNIFVHSKDLGFWTQQTITVQRLDADSDVVWCNHAGAVEEVVYNQIDRVDAPDIVWQSQITTCDKCRAYKLEQSNFWQDTPEEGKSYE